MRQSRTTITIYHGRRDTELEWRFPMRWIICEACEGHGTTTRHIECDGGGFTASEWAEACDDDPDFAEDYFSGRYDRPCDYCKGLGRVEVIDEERITSWRDKAVYKAYCEQLEDDRDYRAMCEAERRMGC